MLLPAGILLPGALEEAKLLSMSTLNEDGVMDVKQTACERLLTSRVEVKMQVGLALTLLPGSASGLGMSAKSSRHQPFSGAQPAEACVQWPSPAFSPPAPCPGALQSPAVSEVVQAEWQATISHCMRVCHSTNGTPADLSSLAALLP